MADGAGGYVRRLLDDTGWFPSDFPWRMREIEDQASLSSGSHRRLSAVNSQLRLGMEADRVGRAAKDARPTQRYQQIPQIPGRYQIRLRRTR
ncbi:hypothetical protein I7I50_04948 [Histoplasma capsulatum G186AR]|uniref:Uncharacterized protein n=1 Tax=Ajellomyces capsulatus TaxID=5037 RepID=A0A8H7Z6A5_AJECA|nr:hypothetical protein I7I52_03206 [Histoplasma capsulatum]QSS75721.1 hypothetical protein I7I50_04948 [Histoplasma capsulatum G186AR]